MNIRGLWAELAAIGYLRKKGYRILRTHYRANGGEIDLIGLENGQLAFIEVKSSARLGDGAKRVDREKRRLLKKAAQGYLHQYGEQSFRFDILEESDAGFRLIRNAF